MNLREALHAIASGSVSFERSKAVEMVAGYIETLLASVSRLEADMAKLRSCGLALQLGLAESKEVIADAKGTALRPDTTPPRPDSTSEPGRQLFASRAGRCAECNGHGVSGGRGAEYVCPTCHGTGAARERLVCTWCYGQHVAWDPCLICRSTGHVYKENVKGVDYHHPWTIRDDGTRVCLDCGYKWGVEEPAPGPCTGAVPATPIREIISAIADLIPEARVVPFATSGTGAAPEAKGEHSQCRCPLCSKLHAARTACGFAPTTPRPCERHSEPPQEQAQLCEGPLNDCCEAHVRKLLAAYFSCNAERDQLRAECERLRDKGSKTIVEDVAAAAVGLGMDAERKVWAKVHDELKAERDAARADLAESREALIKVMVTAFNEESPRDWSSERLRRVAPDAVADLRNEITEADEARDAALAELATKNTHAGNWDLSAQGQQRRAEAAEARVRELEAAQELDTIVRDAAVAALERARELEAWDEAPLPEDDSIKEAHPLRSGRHDLYAEAMRLVGARRSKAGLVELVNWLLVQAREPCPNCDLASRQCDELNGLRPRAAAAEAALERARALAKEWISQGSAWPADQGRELLAAIEGKP